MSKPKPLPKDWIKHPIERIREAFMVLSDAIAELEHLRAQALAHEVASQATEIEELRAIRKELRDLCGDMEDQSVMVPAVERPWRVLMDILDRWERPK